MTVVGGGGLAAGILIGMERSGWSGTVPLLTMETEGADCFNAAIQKKEIVKLEAINSVATSLGICWKNTVIWVISISKRYLCTDYWC